ncbi:MAG TPA: ABC transporter permease, partial [Chryseobacterium sp.]|nr:ABC transporter permease [Chryseobacterium sp.]
MSKKFKIIAFFITVGIMISVAVNLNIGFMKLNFADFFVSDT